MSTVRLAAASGRSASGSGKRATAFELLLACAAAFPGVALLALLSLAVRAAIVLGHWPRPMIDDPKGLGFDLHYDLVVYLVTAAIISPLAFVVFTLMHLTGIARTRHLDACALVFVLCIVAFWMTAVLDPGQVISWLGD
jgi:hypothetical protein